MSSTEDVDIVLLVLFSSPTSKFTAGEVVLLCDEVVKGTVLDPAACTGELAGFDEMGLRLAAGLSKPS